MSGVWKEFISRKVAVHPELPSLIFRLRTGGIDYADLEAELNRLERACSREITPKEAAWIEIEKLKRGEVVEVEVPK